MEKAFKRIAGYEPVKKELLKILEWHNNSDKYEEMGLRLPRGIIFYGRPGNGKSLFMREYARMFNLPIIAIVGDSDNIEDEIIEAFRKARKQKSVILLDELDLLVDGNNYITRILQEEMDGFYEEGSPFVIAACNKIYSIPDPLKRSGRFDRTISISYPNKKSRVELFKMYLGRVNASLKDDELDYLADVCSDVCCSDVTRIVNDCYLRFDGNINVHNLEESYYILFNGLANEYERTEDLKMTSLHEAGHALLTYKNKDYFNFYCATVESAENHRGLCKYYPTNDNDQDLNKMIANIEIGMGGYLATKLLANYQDTGAVSDLKRCNYDMRCLVNSLGYYKGIRNVLREFDPNSRNETEINNHRNEKIVRRLLIKTERNVSRYIKKNKEKLIKISNYLYENGTINQTKFNEFMED